MKALVESINKEFCSRVIDTNRPDSIREFRVVSSTISFCHSPRCKLLRHESWRLRKFSNCWQLHTSFESPRFNTGGFECQLWKARYKFIVTHCTKDHIIIYLTWLKVHEVEDKWKQCQRSWFKDKAKRKSLYLLGGAAALIGRAGSASEGLRLRFAPWDSVDSILSLLALQLLMFRNVAKRSLQTLLLPWLGCWGWSMPPLRSGVDGLVINGLLSRFCSEIYRQEKYSDL